MYPQYGELRPTSGWDCFISLGHPTKFQLVSRLGSVTARHLVVGVSQTAALNRGRHLCSAGRPSCWALAHIFSFHMNPCWYCCVLICHIDQSLSWNLLLFLCLCVLCRWTVTEKQKKVCSLCFYFLHFIYLTLHSYCDILLFMHEVVMDIL